MDGGKTKWHYTRVSAVLIANKINPLTILIEDPEQIQIYHHPNSEYPIISSVLDRLPAYKVNGKYQLHEGDSAHSILNLPNLGSR